MYFDHMDDESQKVLKSCAEYVRSSEDESDKELDDLPELIDAEETDDQLSTSELDEEERIDEYEDAIQRYAQLICEVPQDDIGGIVEMVEKLFEQQYEPDNNNDIIWGVLFSIGVILMATGLRVYFS